MNVLKFLINCYCTVIFLFTVYCIVLYCTVISYLQCILYFISYHIAESRIQDFASLIVKRVVTTYKMIYVKKSLMLKEKTYIMNMIKKLETNLPSPSPTARPTVK